MFYFGADYYPEHWPEERWPEDARLMAEAGFNVVRLAEFAWSKLEPREGHFNFGWLDRAIEILSTHGIKIVLGTPTASPPPWLMAKQEDLF
ncbi:MAG: beta-galactosidase, partial [Chloroflexi bacterium]|nr:beta-galactosidase [Chloroflexota bacterium]